MRHQKRQNAMRFSVRTRKTTASTVRTGNLAPPRRGRAEHAPRRQPALRSPANKSEGRQAGRQRNVAISSLRSAAPVLQAIARRADGALYARGVERRHLISVKLGPFHRG